MFGKIFITSSGYDPQLGKHVKDPYLGPNASLGACRPDIRRQVKVGDHIFVISGKLPNIRQFVMGGFEVVKKIDAREAYEIFPEQRLRLRDDGQLTGNVIVNASGRQHQLDTHEPATFTKRTADYVVGNNTMPWSSQKRSRSAANKISMPCVKFSRRMVDRRGRS